MSLSPVGAVVGTPPVEREDLTRYWLLFLLLGIVSIIVGFVAISSTFIATLASVLVIGVLLLIEGVTEVIHGVLARNLDEQRRVRR